MTPYERRRAWALAHPEAVRASKRESTRRARGARLRLDPTHPWRSAEYERTKLLRCTSEATCTTP